MPRDGQGTFTRTNGVNTGKEVWQDDASTVETILSDRHDTHDQDLADAMTDSLSRNGDGGMLADLDFGGNQATNGDVSTMTVLPVSRTSSRALNVQGTLAQHIVDVTDPDYGAVGDGVTDDTAAINAAIAKVSTNGGIVWFPTGTYLISSTIVAPKTILLGESGRTNTVISMSPSGTYTSGRGVQLGDGTEPEFLSRPENITVDCNDISGSVGIYSNSINNAAGIRDAFVRRAGLYGVYIDGDNAPNQPLLFYLENVEVSMSKAVADGGVSTTDSIGFYLELLNQGAICMGTNLHVTVSGGTTPQAGDCFRFEGVSGTFRNLHAERARRGVLIGSTSPCLAFSIDGMDFSGGNLTEGVRISASPAIKSRHIKIGTVRVVDNIAMDIIIDEINLGASYPYNGIDLAYYEFGDASVTNTAEYPTMPQKVETPAALSVGDQSLSPKVDTSFMRVQATGAGSGIVGIANGSYQRRLGITNLSVSALTIKNSDATAAAGEKIITKSGSDLVLTAPVFGEGPSAEFFYDNATQLWREI